MDDKDEVIENEAIRVLSHAEGVLQKRINAMKAGAPLSIAKNKLLEVKAAITMLRGAGAQ